MHWTSSAVFGRTEKWAVLETGRVEEANDIYSGHRSQIRWNHSQDLWDNLRYIFFQQGTSDSTGIAIE